MAPAQPKFGVRFLTRKERTVRRVTKCETKQIQKRLEPPPVRPVAKVRANPRPRPATLVKARPSIKAPSVGVGSAPSRSDVNLPKSPPKSVSFSTNSRTLQCSDLQKLSRLNCSREFSLFHKEIKSELVSNSQQLAFLQTKLQHLKNEFVNKMTDQQNFEQIREFFGKSLQQNHDRNIKADEFIVLAQKLQQDIKQAMEKWLKKKDFSKQPRSSSEYSQKRQLRIRDLIKETIEEAKKQQQPSDSPSMDDSSQLESLD